MILSQVLFFASSFHQAMVRFVFEHFLELFLFTMALNVVVCIWMLWRRSRRGLKLPKPGDAGVVFVERFAGGRSHKNFLTRMVGSNSLTVIVTDSDLAITTIFPFTTFAGVYDLEHLIPRNKILKIEERGETVDIEFLSQTGTPAKFSLRLSRAGEFMHALGSSQGQPGGMGHAVQHEKSRA